MASMGFLPIKLVLGTAVYSLGVVGGVAAFLKSFSRGEVNELTSLIYDAREHAIGLIRDEAASIGADDVIGIKTHVNELGGLLEFMAIGTAVKRFASLKTVSPTLPPQAIIRDKDTWISHDQGLLQSLKSGKDSDWAAVNEQRRPLSKITLLPLVATTYLMVSGGPYGIEELIQKCGYLTTVLVLVVTPLVWSLPTAMMVGELSAAIPEEGGCYAWARRAGPVLGLSGGVAVAREQRRRHGPLSDTLCAIPGESLAARGWRSDGGIEIGWAVIIACAVVNILGIRVVGYVSARVDGRALDPDCRSLGTGFRRVPRCRTRDRHGVGPPTCWAGSSSPCGVTAAGKRRRRLPARSIGRNGIIRS